ncbi:MAG TPA: hypothetical protein VLB76_28060 [Thermoanaerobaculia bacterium]|jgi:hypothetical protein|nr:hypothetical protein [Thermoanaerobaculia bacterium]
MEPPRLEPAPPPASPFDPVARPVKGGCPKPLIFGCLGLLVLAGLVLVGFFLYAGTHVGKLLQFSLRQSEASILTQLPKDVTPEEQQRLRAAFQGARERALKPGNMQEIAESSQQLQLKMLATIRKGQNLTRKDVQELTLALEQFAKTGRAPDAV